MLKKHAKTAVAGLLIGGVMAAGSAAYAGSPENLNGWAEKAGAEIQATMNYPAFALRRGADGAASYRVTIDRDGDVIDSVALTEPKNAMIRSAARRVVARADLPALPASFGEDTLTLRVNLNYQISNGIGATKSTRQGYVSGQEIASAGAPTFASLEILTDQAED